MTEQLTSEHEFAREMGHAFNNYFSGMQGYLDLLENHLSSENQVDEKSQKYIDNIRSSIQSAIDLNKKLSHFAHTGEMSSVGSAS